MSSHRVGILKTHQENVQFDPHSKVPMVLSSLDEYSSPSDRQIASDRGQLMGLN